MEVSLYIIFSIGLLIFLTTCLLTHIWVGTCSACRYRHLLPTHVVTSYLPFNPVEITERTEDRRRQESGADRSSTKYRRVYSRRLPSPPPSSATTPPPSVAAPPSVPVCSASRSFVAEDCIYNYSETPAEAGVTHLAADSRVSVSDGAPRVITTEDTVSRDTVDSLNNAVPTVSDPVVLSDKDISRPSRARIPNYSSFL